MMIGYVAENALGIRMRELFRTIAAEAIEGTRFFTVLATVALHRALEGVIIVLNTLLVAGVLFLFQRRTIGQLSFHMLQASFSC
jgi:hypothetical protein